MRIELSKHISIYYLNNNLYCLIPPVKDLFVHVAKVPNDFDNKTIDHNTVLQVCDSTIEQLNSTEIFNNNALLEYNFIPRKEGTGHSGYLGITTTGSCIVIEGYLYKLKEISMINFCKYNEEVLKQGEDKNLRGYEYVFVILAHPPYNDTDVIATVYAVAHDDNNKKPYNANAYVDYTLINDAFEQAKNNYDIKSIVKYYD